MRNLTNLVVMSVLALVLGASGLAAQQMRFQGRLTGPGPSFTPTTVATSVRFRIYDHPTNTTPVLWEETQTITPAATGVFSTNLGATVPLTGIDFSQTLYLGVRVGTDPEMVPRYMLTSTSSAFYANEAGNSETLDGLDSTAFALLSGANFTGNVSSTGTFSGNGSGLTNVNASTLGGLARTGFAELTGANFTGNVSTTGVFSGSGSGLTNVNASTLGGLARSGFAELTGASFSGVITAPGFNSTGTVSAGTLSATNFVGGNFVGNGSGLTNVNAVTLAGNAPSAFALLGAGSNTFSGTVQATTITATTGFVGNLTGNVTGNVSGTSAGFTGSLSGDVTGTQAATLIANNAVTTAKILDGTILGADLNSAINITTTGNIASRNAALADGDLTWTATAGNAAFLQLPDETESNNLIRTPSAGAVRYNSGTSAVEVWNGTTWVAGNGYFAGSGLSLVGNTFNVSSLGITTAMLANDAVNTGKILDGTITGADLSGAISISTSGSVTAASFSGNGAALTNLTGANVTGPVANSTTAVNFSGTLAGDVTGTQGATVIGAGAVTSIKILDGTITGADLNSGINITTSGAIIASTFNGNGSGLTSLTAANVTGSLVDAQINNDITLNSSAPISGSAGLTISSGGANISGGLVVSGGNITGNLIGNITGTSSGFTGLLAGDVIGTQGATVVTTVGGQTSANIALGVAAANNATNTNTPSRIVIRDASGNFSANTVSANLAGNVTGNLTGNVLGNVTGNVTGNLTGDASNALLLGGLARAGFAELTGATFTGGVTATSFGGNLTGNVTGDVTGNLFGNATTATTAATATSATTATTASNALLLGGLARAGFAELTGATFTGGVTATSFSGNLTGNVTGDVTGNLFGNATTATTAATATSATTAATASNALLLGGLARTGFAELTGATFTGGVTATSFSGDLTGNVTGNVSGNVTGNVSGTSSGFTGNLAGDVTGPQGATVIANGGVTSAKILDGTITGADLNGAISITTTGNYSGVNATLNNGDMAFTAGGGATDAAFLQLPSEVVSDNAKRTPGAVGAMRYNTGTSAVEVWNGTSWVAGASYTAGSGLTLTGSQFSVSALGIVNGMLANDAVTTGKILDATIIGADLDPNINIATAGLIQSGSMQTTTFTSNTVTAAAGNFVNLAVTNLTFTSATILADLTVGQDLYVTRDAFVGDDLSVTDTLTVAGATSLSTVSTSGLATLNSASVTNNLTVGGDIAVDDIAAAGNLSVLGSTSLNTLGTSGLATLFAVNVTNNAAIGGTLNVTGNTGLSTVSTSGAATLNSASVTNNATVGGTLGVTGSTSLSTLSTSGAATLNSVSVTNNATVGGTLGVTGNTSLSTVSTSGAATLDSVGVTNNATVGGTLGVTSLLTASNGLTVSSGTVSLPAGEIGNAELANSSLTVTAGTGLTGGGVVSLGGSITIDSTGTLSVTGTANQIDVTAGQNPTISISTTYVGQTSITTLGTITTGVWNGTSITDANVDNNLTINGGTVDNTIIGGTTAAAATVTDLTATGTISLPAGSISNTMLANSSLTVSAGTNLTGGGAVSLGGTVTLNLDPNYAGQNTITTLGTITTGVWNGTSITDANVDNNLTINGGSVNNTVIGATTAASGAFTSLSASTGLNVSGTVNINTGSSGGTNIGNLTNGGPIYVRTGPGNGIEFNLTNGFDVQTGGLITMNSGGSGWSIGPTGNFSTGGSITAGSFSGNGSLLTNLNASNLSTGTIPSARLSGNYTSALTFSNAGNAFTGSYTGNGSGLTSLNASNLSSGTIPNTVLSGTYTNALTLSNGTNSFTGTFVYSPGAPANWAGAPTSVAEAIDRIAAALASGTYVPGTPIP